MRQELHGGIVFGEALLFLAETDRMGLPAAVGKPDWMLHMKHFVVKDIADNIFRNTRSIETAIHNDLVECRIEAAQLCPPCPTTPGKARHHQGAVEILAVQATKQHKQVVVLASGLVLQPPRPKPAKLQKSLTRGGGIGKMAVTLE